MQLVVRFAAEISLDDESLDSHQAERLKQAGLVTAVLGLNENRSPAFVREHRGASPMPGVSGAGRRLRFRTPANSRSKEDRMLAVRSRSQEIDLFNVYEALGESGRRWRLDASALPQAFFFAGDDARLQPEAGSAMPRLLGEAERFQANYAARKWPLAGAASSAHTALTFERWGRRALAYVPRQAQGNIRPLGEGERVRISQSAKMLWDSSHYQLSVFAEIALEEAEIRELDLRRRGRDLSADKVLGLFRSRRSGSCVPGSARRTFSDRGMRGAGNSPSLWPTSSAKCSGTPRAGPRNLLARAPRETREALRRQLATLFQHGALETEGQARRSDQQETRGEGGNGGNGSGHGNNGGGGGGPRPPGQGRRRRRRRGRGRDGGGPPRVGAP